MDYWLQHVFTGREYAKLVKAITKKHCDEPETPPEHVKQIRSFVRLFGKVWIASFLTEKLARRETFPTKLSSAIVACALSYRLIFKWLSQSKRFNGERNLKFLRKYSVLISGAIAGYILTLGLPINAAIVASIYLASKVCEWGYNVGEYGHKFDWKPDFIGAWSLFPVAFSQLFHVLMTSPSTCPKGFKRLMVALSNGSLEEFSRSSGVALEVSRTSMSYFPQLRSSLVYQSEVSSGSLMLSSHPGVSAIEGMLLNPQMNGTLQCFLNIAGSDIALISKYLLPVYLLRAYLGDKSYEKAIVQTLRVALIYSLTAASALVGVHLSQKAIGRPLSSQARFRLIGLFSGLWGLLNREHGAAQFLYATRLAVLSLVPPSLHATVSSILMPVSMAGAFHILNTRPEAITQRLWKKIGIWVQSDIWVNGQENEDRLN